jgi:hypothetical protein
MPFSEVVGTGYCDGLLSGLLKCGRCNREFKFDTLYENLDGPIRFFSVAPLPAGSLDRFAKAVGEYQSPTWPIWVPLWSFPTEEVARSLRRLSESICGEAGPLAWVLAWDLGSNHIAACRPYPTGHPPETPTGWIRYCDLPPEVTKDPEEE